MSRAGGYVVRRPAAVPLAARAAVAALVLAAVLLPVATVQAASPNASAKPHGHKATPTPPPVVTPVPVPTPTPTPRPVITPAPTARPAISPAPTSALTAAPAPKPAPGRTTAPGTGGGSMPGGGRATPRPGASGSRETKGPGAVGGVVGPGDGSGSGGSGGSSGSHTGGPPAGLIVVVALIGGLTMLGAWLLGGRRKRDHDADVATAAPVQAGSSAQDAPPAAATPRTTLGRSRLAARSATAPSTTEPPEPRPGRVALPGDRFQDPLVAAITRSRDARSTAGLSRPTPSTGAGPTNAASAADPGFKGPTWVTRLDPHIKIAPTLPVERDRADQAS